MFFNPVDTPKLQFPLANFQVNGEKFLEDATHDGIYWGKHLGVDTDIQAGAEVLAIGNGKVLYARLHAAKQQKQGMKRNWGNIIILVHKHIQTNTLFFSLYGHVAKPLVKEGDEIQKGQMIAKIAQEFSLENGWWEAHLHFAIYTGPWENKILPGYYREDQNLTKVEHWENPEKFIQNYPEK